MAAFDPNKPSKVATALQFLLLLLVAGGLVYWYSTWGPTADEKEAARLAERAEAARSKEARRVHEAIRMGLRDPDSLAFEALLVSDNATIACAVYRARNGFGGMNKSSLIVVNDKVLPSTPENSKRHCAGLKDYSFVTR